MTKIIKDTANNFPITNQFYIAIETAIVSYEKVSANRKYLRTETLATLRSWLSQTAYPLDLWDDIFDLHHSLKRKPISQALVKAGLFSADDSLLGKKLHAVLLSYPKHILATEMQNFARKYWDQFTNPEWQKQSQAILTQQSEINELKRQVALLVSENLRQQEERKNDSCLIQELQESLDAMTETLLAEPARETFEANISNRDNPFLDQPAAYQNSFRMFP